MMRVEKPGESGKSGGLEVGGVARQRAGAETNLALRRLISWPALCSFSQPLNGASEMKAIPYLSAVAVLLLVPSPCFARWAVLLVSKEEAKEFGMQVRTTATGSNEVSVELEFKPEGYFKEYSRVELWIGEGDKPQVTAPLREDRSNAGRVVVGFTVDRLQLDQSNLRLVVPHSGRGAKGVTYMLRVKDFVKLEPNG